MKIERSGAKGGAAISRRSQTQAESCLRPLLRRRLRTARPAFVDIRLRNPWSRLRLILLGWKVRFTVRTSCVIASMQPGNFAVESGPPGPRFSGARTAQH